MSRIGNVEERNRRFVAKSIRDWDEHRAREKREAAPPSYRRRHGAGGPFRQVYGIAALMVFLAFAAAWPQVAPALTALPGASSLIGTTTGGAQSGGIARTAARHFPICGAGKRTNCVVDGDTVWIDGEKIRIADIDTPEISSPKCGAEKARGDQATRRLQSLLNQGSFEMRGSGNDKYGRGLRTLHRDGRSLGGTLVDEGLAHEWKGFKESWCG